MFRYKKTRAKPRAPLLARSQVQELIQYQGFDRAYRFYESFVNEKAQNHSCWKYMSVTSFGLLQADVDDDDAIVFRY